MCAPNDEELTMSLPYCSFAPLRIVAVYCCRGVSGSLTFYPGGSVAKQGARETEELPQSYVCGVASFSLTSGTSGTLGALDVAGDSAKIETPRT